MVAQTTVNSNNGNPSPPQAVARNTGELLGDAMTLAELQGKLLVIDVQSDLQKLIVPVALIVSGAVLALSCLPVALVTIALGLMAGFELAPWLAFLVTLGIGLVVALAVIFAGVWCFRHGLTFLQRSRAEWQQNVQWFKSLVRRLGTSTPSRPAEPGRR